MNPSSQGISTEIQKLLQSLNEENYDDVVHQLSQYIEYGTEESILLVENCLHHFKIYKQDLKSIHLQPAVALLFRKLMERPHFCKVFSGLVKYTEISENFLDNLSTSLQLSPFEKLGFGLALSVSENNDVRMAGRKFCMAQFEELCELAERGHIASVRSLLTFPLEHFPELPLLGMAHVITPQNLIQNELSSAVFPLLLKDTSMSGLVLNLWHVNPPFFSRALNAALNLNPENMNRVVDFLEELEILIPVLDSVPIYLGSRRAAVPSQKELVDLEEWLRSNLSTYDDMFFVVCVGFLKEVEHDIQEPSNKAQKSGGIWNLYKEAAPTFSMVLQEHTAFLSSNQLNRLIMEMESLHITSTHNRPIIENISDPDSSTFEVDSDHKETEANAYFQQMFSGQLTTGAVVQMLTRFKGSSGKREQLVFEYMISNLLQVNKFFNRYPDEQVQLAAVLCGLLIRHQVVSNSTQSIALQAVLDALHEPADSKTFIFGAKVLENIVDRLIEWPEYCQQVLQISHLRGTRSELVSVIEQTLGRTSSGHPELELDETNNLGTDQLSSSIPPPANIEMSGSSFPLTGSDGVHLGSQVSSPTKLQQRNESHSDDIQKASLTSPSHTNPNLSTSGQKSVGTLISGSVSIQKKPQSVVRPSALKASSPEFSPPSRAVTLASRFPVLEEKPSWFVSASNGTLLSAAQRRETPIHAPPSRTQDKISFLFNTLSAANIEAKAKEFTEILEEQYYPWFAQYIVIKRASKEPTFHMLYIKVLEKANSKRLMEEIVRETYENCKVLLRSDLIQSSTEERLLLKNLGGWLGKITIGRNKVLLSRQVDPKSLVIEAYEKGLMIGIIPFTSMVLEPCKGSLAYQPPNPWTMAILGLLAEIKAMPNLKANIKFSIEILFKKLDLDMKAVTPTSLLKDRVRKIEGNPDFSNEDVESSQQNTLRSTANQGELPHEATGPSYQGGGSHVLYQHAAPPHFPAVTVGEDINMLFQRVLPTVMDNAVKEIFSSIIEKSVSIATQTTMALVLKEYVTDSDENYTHNASCSIIVCLAGNLSYVTSKEPLRSKLSSQLRISLQGLNIASEFLEHAIQHVIDDNLELGCAAIEKSAIEKGLIIVQKEIAYQLSVRRKHRESSRAATFDPNLFAEGNIGAFPVAFHPQAAHISLPQQQAYKDFDLLPWQDSSQHSYIMPDVHAASSVSGSLRLPSDSHPHNSKNEGVLPSFCMVPAPLSHVSGPSNVAIEFGVHQQTSLPLAGSIRFMRDTIESSLTTGAALDEYQVLAKKLESLIAKDAKEAEIQSVIGEVPVVLLRCINKDGAALAVAQTVFEGLYENASNSAHVNAHIAILAAVSDVSKLVGKELTSWLLNSNDESKFNKDITVGLIHRELLNLTEYDAHMANLIGAGKSGAAMEFCISLVRTLEASDARLLSTLQNVVETLAKVTNHPVVSREVDDPSISSKPDPPGFHWQVTMLFTDWCRIRDHPGVNDAACVNYVLQLYQNILSKADDIPHRFFRHLLELAVSHYLSSEGTNQADLSSFLVIDIYTELVFSILKFCPDQGSNKLSLFSKVLAVIVRFIKRDAEEKKESFISKPYFRLFVNFYNHLGTLNSAIDDANFQILSALSNSFHALQPVKVPAFSFTWVELISHKDFMPKLFAANGRKGWPYFKRLLVDLLQFMEPLLRNGELTEPVRQLYKGTLRVLLVLVHDFPDFVCYYHFNFCEVMASRCVQLRNIILSAFPENMRLPNPNSPNLKVDLLAEMSQPPCIDPKFVAALKANKMKDDVDEYLMTRPEVSSFLFELRHKLLLSTIEAERSGTYYNVPLINSLVLYVGTKAIQQLQASTASNATSIARFMSMAVYFAGAALDIFRTLILNLNSEGRYLFFNAVADQLRYPNNHTHFFSFVLLHFFVEIKEEAIQEQITRVLLERLITKLPHPWGVQVTFIELVKNPGYKFWSHNFTRSDPEIKRVFDSVSTSLDIQVQDVAASAVL